jgi:hypothetical protein
MPAIPPTPATSSPRAPRARPWSAAAGVTNPTARDCAQLARTSAQPRRSIGRGNRLAAASRRTQPSPHRPTREGRPSTPKRAASHPTRAPSPRETREARGVCPRRPPTSVLHDPRRNTSSCAGRGMRSMLRRPSPSRTRRSAARSKRCPRPPASSFTAAPVLLDCAAPPQGATPPGRAAAGCASNPFPGT